MTVAEILVELGSRGVLVVPQGAFLRLYPGSALTPQLLECIREHKHELLAAVSCAAPRPITLPTRAEWDVLTSLARGPRASRSALARAVRLPGPVVDQAVCTLLRRGEIALRRDGSLAINPS